MRNELIFLLFYTQSFFPDPYPQGIKIKMNPDPHKTQAREGRGYECFVFNILEAF